jgi:hypothetical protein
MSIVIRQYPSDIDPEFIKIFKERWKDHDGEQLLQSNMWYERYYILWQYAKGLSSLDGDFVECGTYSGSDAKFLATECKTTLHLIDSFEGLSEVGEYDNPWYEENKFIANLEELKETLKSHKNVKYYKGWVPDVLSNIDTNISLLALDLDLYEPTKNCLEYFWDKVVDGGVVICDFHDDYAWGAEKATRDFFQDIRDIEVLATGKAIIIK